VFCQLSKSMGRKKETISKKYPIFDFQNIKIMVPHIFSSIFFAPRHNPLTQLGRCRLHWPSCRPLACRNRRQPAMASYRCMRGRFGIKFGPMPPRKAEVVAHPKPAVHPPVWAPLFQRCSLTVGLGRDGFYACMPLGWRSHCCGGTVRWSSRYWS
jgi:hypothetical protein